ncbi:MAG TPA: DUF4157 domain-containing protein [Longimicrobium sp.]|nr:DUF4157 domain-containing protein [Longimicrobium sp.]
MSPVLHLPSAPGRRVPAPAPALAPPTVHRVLRAPGRPLDAGVRAEMEPRFGHSFADVRVHADADAAESARSVGARAYAVGRSVVFAAGRYAPGSADGRRLIAHELAHVVQQRGAASLQPRLEIGAADDPAEREAEAVAADTAIRPAIRSGTGTLRRQQAAKSTKKPAKAAKATLTYAEVQTLVSANNKSGLSDDLVVCLIWKESGFKPGVKNAGSSATGLMQMTKGAVTQVNKSSPKGVHFEHSEMKDPAKNVEAGTRYLKIRVDWAKGDKKAGLEGFGTGAGYAKPITTCESCLAKAPEDPTPCLHAIHE